MRNGQQAALALDAIALLDALEIPDAIVGGFDWGARTADIIAALWPERCRGLVSVSGYLIGSQQANRDPLPPAAELAWWYQYYFATDRGRAGYDRYRREFARLIWQTASPQWAFDDATFDRSAASFDNPDHVDIVIHNYRWRLGIAAGRAAVRRARTAARRASADHRPDDHAGGRRERRAASGAGAYRASFTGPYAHRLVAGGVGHNLPQEAPREFAHAVLDVETAAMIRSIVHRLAGDAAELPDEGALGPVRRRDGLAQLGAADARRPSADASCSSTSGPTPASTGSAPPPYLRAWDAKYRGRRSHHRRRAHPGVRLRARSRERVARTRDLGIEYPVAIDSDYGVWNAFANHYWPAIYLADATGRIRFHHFGEGEYAATEMMIQRLLADAGAPDVDQDLVMVEPQGPRGRCRLADTRSPESYLGYGQSDGLRVARIRRNSTNRTTTSPPLGFASTPGISRGNWTVARHAAILNQPGGRIAFQFRARDVNLVMGPDTRGREIPFRVLLDGQAVGDARAVRMSHADGRGTVRDQNTYQLIRQAGPIVERRFEIEFLEAGVEGYCFTFG